MAQGFFLSEGDARILKDMIQEYRRKPKVQASADLSDANDAMFAPEVYVAEIPASGIPAMAKNDEGEWIPGSATCRVRRIWPKVVTGTETDENKYLLQEQEFVNRLVYNINLHKISGLPAVTGTGTADWEGSGRFETVLRDKWGKWLIPKQEALIGGKLAEDHPGYSGAEFDLYLAEWDPSSNGWYYDETSTVMAVDWRYGVPYPDAGATGLFTPRISTEFGIIWECVALDCESSSTGTGSGTGSV